MRALWILIAQSLLLRNCHLTQSPWLLSQSIETTTVEQPTMAIVVSLVVAELIP